MSRATHQLAQLWQLPLLLLSLVLFALAGYLFVNAPPGLTVRKRIDLARAYIRFERPEAALDQLNRLLATERLEQENEAAVHGLIAEALESAQRQRKISIAANHNRIIRQTQLALSMGAVPTCEIHRRLGESLQALGRASEAISQYRQAMALDPARALRLQRKIIEVQSQQADAAGAMAALDEYLAKKELSDAERAWALGEKSQILADRGEFVAARALIADALRLDADPIAQAQANYRMAYCAWKLGKSEEAQRLARSARDQFANEHPLDADAAFLLAQIHQEQEDWTGAIELYRIVLTRLPENRFALDARLGEAVCRVNAGQERAGLAALRELVDLMPPEPVKARMCEAALKSLHQIEQLLAGKSHYDSALEAMELERVLAAKTAGAGQSADYLQRLASVTQKRFEQLEQPNPDASPAQKVRQNCAS